MSVLSDLVNAVVFTFLTVYIGAKVLDYFAGTGFAVRIRHRLFSGYRLLQAETSRWAARAVVVVAGFAAIALGHPLVTLFGFGLLCYGAYRYVRVELGWRLHLHAIKRHIKNGEYALPFYSSQSKSVGLVEKWGNALAIAKNRSTLILGATRSGKTEVAKTLLFQMTVDENEPIVIYDHKEDFQEFYGDADNVLRLSTRGSTATWNLFREVEDERDFDELGRALFPKNTGGNEFFDTSARQTFVAVCKYLSREIGAEQLSNRNLVNYFQRKSRDEMYEDITEHEDLIAAASALDPDASKQSVGVYASLQQKVQDVFVGDFAAESDRGDMSIREYMANPNGRVLILDYPQKEGDSVKPIFRYLIDTSAMHALADTSPRGAYFVLDEFARIPGLRRIGDLVNVGAGRQIQVLLTLQSVNQLYDNYGRERGTSILAGLTTQVILRLQDDDSIEHARTAIGTEFTEYTKHVERGESIIDGMSSIRSRETKMEEEHSFAKGEFTKLDPGYGWVVRPDSWCFGYAPLLDDVHAGILAEAYQQVEQEAISDAVTNGEPFPWDEEPEVESANGETEYGDDDPVVGRPPQP